MAAYYSETKICNKALARLSIPPLSSDNDTIDTCKDNTKAANACKLEYPICRDQLLEDTVWSFATTRDTLTDPEILEPSSYYAYKFRIPYACINLHSVGDRSSMLFSNVDYSIENGFILANSDVLHIKYTTTLGSEGIKLASSSFIDTLSLKLAMALCMPLTENRTLYNDLATEFSNSLQNSSGSDGAQSPNQKIRFQDLRNHR